MQRVSWMFSFIVGGVVAGVLAAPPLKAGQEAGAADDAEAAAEEDYTMRCVACHGADGDSQLPNMSFADGVWRHGSSEEEIATTITDGVPGTAMMPFKGQLSEEQVLALAKYIRQFDPSLGDEEDPK